MEDKKNVSHKLVNIGVKAVLAGGAAYGIYKIYRAYEKNKTENQTDKKPEVGQAMIIRSAMNPSGMEWLKSTDGTNTEAILNTAKEITDLNLVMNAYKNLFNSSMLEDLQKELSPEDYTKFLNTLKFSSNNKNKGRAGAPKNNFKRATPLITKLRANLRKTPKNISHWSYNSNVIKSIIAKQFIGFATGKTEFDNAGTGETGTLFIEVQSVSLDTRKPVFFWVASSQLEAISVGDYKARKYPFFLVNEKDTLSGMENINQKPVMVFRSTPVLDEKFQPVGLASPLKLLGYSIMELNDKKGNEYVKFITPENRQHWINKKYVQVI